MEPKFLHSLQDLQEMYKISRYVLLALLLLNAMVQLLGFLWLVRVKRCSRDIRALEQYNRLNSRGLFTLVLLDLCLTVVELFVLMAYYLYILVGNPYKWWQMYVLKILLNNHCIAKLYWTFCVVYSQSLHCLKNYRGGFMSPLFQCLALPILLLSIIIYKITDLALLLCERFDYVPLLPVVCFYGLLCIWTSSHWTPKNKDTLCRSMLVVIVAYLLIYPYLVLSIYKSYMLPNLGIFQGNLKVNVSGEAMLENFLDSVQSSCHDLHKPDLFFLLEVIGQISVPLTSILTLMILALTNQPLRRAVAIANKSEGDRRRKINEMHEQLQVATHQRRVERMSTSGCSYSCSNYSAAGRISEGEYTLLASCSGMGATAATATLSRKPRDISILEEQDPLILLNYDNTYYLDDTEAGISWA